MDAYRVLQCFNGSMKLAQRSVIDIQLNTSLIESARHSSSTTSSTAKILYPCPLSKLDMSAQQPAQQQDTRSMDQFDIPAQTPAQQ